MSTTNSFLTSLRASLGSAASTRRLTDREDPTPSPAVVQSTTFKEKLRNVISSPKVTQEETTVDKRESLIRDKLARFACLPVSQIFSLLPGSSPAGLTNESVRIALDEHGPNIHSGERRLGPLAVLLAAFANPFNFILIGLAIVSIATGDRATFSVMIIMVVLSTGLRFWQELKSISQAANLLDSVTNRVRVLRNKEEVEIDRKEVVPGDVLVLTSGDVFPGDCVLLSSEALSVTQALLTGESTPVEKGTRLVIPESDYRFDLLDNENICLDGTSVVTGSGRALVVSTGDKTYMASIAKDLAKRRPLNVMQVGVRKVSYLLLLFMGVMAPLVFVIQGCVSKDWRSAALFAISVAVGITPEMLPMVVASNLALSAARVAAQKVIVKRFDAIQTLGAVTILCSDKTGTLTIDQIQVSTSTTGSGAQSDLPLKLAYLNSALQTGTRSLLDRAIVDSVQENAPKSTDDKDDDAQENGNGNENNNNDGGVRLEEWDKLAEIPFDSTRRLLSVLVSSRTREEKALLVTKGAVEEVLDGCTEVYDHQSSTLLTNPSANLNDFSLDGTTSVLTADARTRILQTAEKLNKDGLRLVAVACKTVDVKPFMTVTSEDEMDLVFIGFLGFLEPLKPDAADAVQKLAKLGVQVRILTGDAPAVAVKVARDLGILSVDSTPSDGHVVIEMEPPLTEDDLVITGAKLASLAKDQEEFDKAIERCIVFAKLSPHQKLQVVEGLRKGGNAGGGPRAVAYLGDGVNDSLAIHAADVGISVDSGTEITKEAADVILLEKSLDVIVQGIMQGRITFVNTIKYIKMATSSNFGNVFSVLIASAWLPYQPILPFQLLFQNLLYDFSQASIPWDNVDPEYLAKPRTWNAKSIAQFMVIFGPTSTVFDICIFLINWYHYGIRDMLSPLVPQAQTAWFLEGAITQVFIIHFLRTHKIPFFQSRASLPVVITTTLIACLVMAIPYIPKFNTAFGMMAPPPEFYGFLAAIFVCYALLVQLVKVLSRPVLREWL